MIDGTLITMVALLAALAAYAHARGGPELVASGFGEGGRMLVRFGPVIVVSFLAAGFADALIPQAWIRERLGAESGLGGILLAVCAGVVGRTALLYRPNESLPPESRIALPAR